MIMDAKTFYSLFPNSWIQTFDDAKLGRKELCMISSIKDAWYEKLQKLNEQWAWIFIQPNPSTGRKEEDVTSIEWVYVDMDDGTKAEMMEIISKSPIAPDIIIESKRSYHLYWKVHCTKEQFKLIIEWLITFFGWDTAISSPNEVLRAPTFWHAKNPDDRFQIKIHHLNIAKHAPQDFIKVFPSNVSQIIKKLHLDPSEDVIRVIKGVDIVEILRHCWVDVRRWVIFEDWKATSASVWKEGNIVKRFSGKEWGGSNIDIVMHYLWKTTAEAIKYLKDYAGIVDETMLEKVTKKTEEAKDFFEFLKPYTYGTNFLDKVMTPIQRNHYNLFVWETGHGKTAFCFYMAKKNAELWHKVLFLSLEMTTNDICIRSAREYAGITKELWREKSSIPDSQKKAFKEKYDELKNKDNLTLAWFPKSIQPTCENIASLILDWKFDLVYIDNFDLISETWEKLQQEEKVTKFFMDFTNQNHIPIIMLHHFKKGNDKWGNRGNDSIRGSSKISHSADNIFVGKRNSDQDSTDADKSEFAITQLKDRDFWIWWYASVYFNKWDFQDLPLYIWF